jgi:formylmethanofuran dehydrogenase subunit E
MARARYRQTEYELVNFTADAEWVLRDETGDVLVFEEGERERVEVQCERCGRWSTAAAPAVAGGRWVCHDTACHDAERGDA